MQLFENMNAHTIEDFKKIQIYNSLTEWEIPELETLHEHLIHQTDEKRFEAKILQLDFLDKSEQEAKNIEVLQY